MMHMYLLFLFTYAHQVYVVCIALGICYRTPKRVQATPAACKVVADCGILYTLMSKVRMLGRHALGSFSLDQPKIR